jgi:hypothetical protein
VGVPPGQVEALFTELFPGVPALPAPAMAMTARCPLNVVSV